MTKTDITWRLDSKVRFRRILDEGVAIHQQKAEALVLNDVAISFLEMCDGKRSVQQIIDLMAEQYDTTVEVLNRDIPEFAQKLSENGMIERV